MTEAEKEREAVVRWLRERRDYFVAMKMPGEALAMACAETFIRAKEHLQ